MGPAGARVLAISFWLFSPRICQANEYGGITALDMVEGVRSQGLGGAGCALGRDANLLWINPAAVAESHASITLGGLSGFSGEITAQGLGTLRLKEWTVCAGLAYYDTGALDSTDEYDNPVSGSFHRDWLAVVGAGRTFGFLTTGVSVKGQYSEMMSMAPESRIAVDAGVQARLLDILKLGLVGSTIGTGLVSGEVKARSRTQVRGGLAAAVNWPGDMHPDRFLFVLDTAYSFADREVTWPGGVEIWWKEALAFRIGGHLSQRKSLGALSFGLCAAGGNDLAGFMRKFRVDYSIRVLNDTLNPPQAVSLTVEL
jgi:hypothetical protein